MKVNKNKIKTLIFIATIFLVCLIVGCVTLLVSIFKTKSTIEKQNAEIEKLNNQIEYYKQLEQNNQTPDYEIVEED